MVPFGDSHTEGLGWVQYRISDGRTLLQLKLLDTSLIRSYGRTLDSDRVLFDSFRGIYGNLIVGLVTVFQSLSKLGSGTFSGGN
jgi:hypothetical protein